MKKFAIIVLAGLLMALGAGAAWAFTDTDDLSAAEVAAVEKLRGLGVMEGYPDGTFRPHEPVSRAELAKIICDYTRQSGLSAGNSFTDVQTGAWYYGWVNRATEEGWVNGYPDGRYLPQNSVTQQEATAVLLRIADLDTAGLAWPDEYIQAAREMGLLSGFNFNGTAKASRLTVCLMICNLLEAEKEAEPEALVDGLHIGVVKAVAEREFSLYYAADTLTLDSGVRHLPKEDTLIYFTLKDGAVENWTLLLDAAQGYIAPATAFTHRAVKDGPYAWALTRSGRAVESPAGLSAAQPLVRYHSYRNISVGPTLDNRNYWLGDGCQIYEAYEGKMAPASNDSIEIGKAVTLLVNDNDEAVVLICWK